MSRSSVAILMGAVVWAISWFVSPHQGLAQGQPSHHAAGSSIALARRTQAADAETRTVPAEVERKVDVGGSSLADPGPPGWRAFRISWDMLQDKPPADGDTNWKTRILGATGVTNALMLAAILLALAGVRSRGIGLALLASAVIDLSWVYLNLGEGRFVSGLDAGYYLWVGSFALSGVGWMQRAKAAA